MLDLDAFVACVRCIQCSKVWARVTDSCGQDRGQGKIRVLVMFWIGQNQWLDTTFDIHAPDVGGCTRRFPDGRYVEGRIIDKCIE